MPTAQELIDRYGEPDDIAGDPTNPTNPQRANWGKRAIEDYGRFVNGSADYDDLDGMAGDLLTDVMHHLAREGLDPDEVIERSRRHFVAEVGLGYDGPPRRARR